MGSAFRYLAHRHVVLMLRTGEILFTSSDDMFRDAILLQLLHDLDSSPPQGALAANERMRVALFVDEVDAKSGLHGVLYLLFREISRCKPLFDFAYAALARVEKPVDPLHRLSMSLERNHGSWCYSAAEPAVDEASDAFSEP